DHITSTASRILNGANNLTGVVNADRTIIGGTTQLNQPEGLQLDNSGRLVVSNSNGGSVTIYANAATASGDVAPVATIGGGNTGILSPTQIVLNNATTTGDMYLADGAAGGVLIFAGLSS